MISTAISVSFPSNHERNNICRKSSIKNNLLCIFRELRFDRDDTAMLMNLCLSLLVAIVVFVTGVRHVSNKLVCRSVGVLLHYFVLCSLLWIGCSGICLNRLIRTAIKPEEYNPVLRYYMMSWGKSFNFNFPQKPRDENHETVLCGCDDFWLRTSRCSPVTCMTWCHPAFNCAGGSFACQNPASKPLLLVEKRFWPSPIWQSDEFLTPIISKLDKHVVLLPINYISSKNR